MLLDAVAYDSTEFLRWYVNYNYIQYNQPQFFNTGVTILENGARGGAGNAWYFPEVGSFPSGGGHAYYSFPIPYASWFVGARYYLPSWPTANLSIFLMADSSARQIDIRIGNDGKIRLYRGLDTVIQTSTYSVPEAEWFHFEINAVIDPVNGSVEVRINESQKLVYTGNTSATGLSRANIMSFNGAVIGQKAHDFSIRNSANNETWWGDVSILVLRPHNDAIPIQFLGSDGDQIANYAIVSNEPFALDEYVYTTQDAVMDLYEFPNLQDVSILGVADVVLPDTDECVGTLSALVKAGGLLYQYSTQLVTAGTLNPYIITQLQRSPNTNQLWDLLEFNQATFGQKSTLGASVSGFAFFDELADGIYENPPDRPQSNVTFALYLDNGDLIFNPATDTLIGTIRTNQDGLYGFTGLTVGAAYWVYLPPNPIYDPTTTNPIGPITATSECISLPDMGLFPA